MAIVFYDGLCGLCNRFVQFVLKRDRKNAFRFAPLQGETARAKLPRHGIDPGDLDTVCVLFGEDGPGEQALVKSRAVARVLRELGGPWRIPAALGVLPRGIGDRLYDFVARRRYRWFGKYDACPIPTPEQRARILP